MLQHECEQGTDGLCVAAAGSCGAACFYASGKPSSLAAALLMLLAWPLLLNGWQAQAANLMPGGCG